MKKKIKVLRIINRFNIGGPTFNATFLTRYLSDDFETLLIGGMPEEGEADSLHILEQYGVKPRLIEEMKREPNFKSDREVYLKIKEIIKEFQPDIVHTHAAKAGALGRKAAHSLKVPVILHTFHGHVFHSYFGKVKTTAFKWIERRLAKKSTRIIAISNVQKDELVHEHKICKAKKMEVVNLGFDLAKFQEDIDNKRLSTRKTFAIEDDEVAIAIIGRLVPVKDHQFFLDVIEELKGRLTKRIRVFIVGDGTERAAIENRIEGLDIDQHVRIELTSWIKDIPSFNAGMDVICLTSKNEGTPVSLIEAQASNVPVITTNVGGVSDIIDEGNTGFIVTKGNLKEYTDKLERLIEDENLRKTMASHGWEFVREKFSYTTLVQNMESLYRKLLKEKNDKA